MIDEHVDCLTVESQETHSIIVLYDVSSIEEGEVFPSRLPA